MVKRDARRGIGGDLPRAIQQEFAIGADALGWQWRRPDLVGHPGRGRG